jgi:hypothetical protein
MYRFDKSLDDLAAYLTALVKEGKLALVGGVYKRQAT